MKKVMRHLFFILFAIASAYGMEEEDVYSNKAFIPNLYSYDSIKNNTVTTPFIDTLGCNQLVGKYFSIEILRYSVRNQQIVSSDGSWGEKIGHQDLTNVIINNPHKIAIARNLKTSNRLEHKVFIPIEEKPIEDKQDDFADSTELLALALVAGYRYFQTNQSMITIKDDELEIWKKLFAGYTAFQQQADKLNPRQSFSLNFAGGTITNILTLAALIRPEIDVQRILQKIIATDPDKQKEELSSFLITCIYGEEPQPKIEEPPKTNLETQNRLSAYYAKLRTAREYWYRTIVVPIKNWYDYFYRSYRFWIGLFS